MNTPAAGRPSARARHLRRWALLAAGALLVALVPSVANASHPEVSLSGSNFEIDTDANLKVDDQAPSIDWANVNENRKADTPSGANDESFGQGTKEDTAAPTVVDGSIPPNKSDLKFFGIFQEGNTTNGFLNLFWSRVQEPTGTTNMDFELNKRQCTPNQTPVDVDCTANGLTPIRSTGDLLITYDLAQGGTVPNLSVRSWTGSAWGPATNLTSSNDATGSINSSPIPAADSDGLGAQDPRTFGEAQVRLASLFPDPTVCSSFGSAYLKSRSSDSFTAALKDFVPPEAINITNCGSVKITKTNDVGTTLNGAEFTLYKDNAPVGGTRGNEDTITGLKCTTVGNGTCTIQNVLFGTYWVVETVTPDGHDSAPDQAISVVNTTTVEVTFVDPRQRGAIEITKLRKHAADGPGDHPQSGVDFTVNGVTKTTGADGKVCFDNLLFDSYTVHETTPNGYVGEADKTVAVNNKASCDDSTYHGETVTFHNTPLTNISASADSQINGGTSTTLVCKDSDGNTVASGSTGADGDGSVTASDLKPGTYTCTLVIDP